MKHAFPPIVDKTAHVLILGTMPGEESLRRQEYYAHPQNQFWRILSEIYQAPAGDNYLQRKAFLASKGLALWDVLESCEREGSLDENIKNAVPNQFHNLLEAHPNIKTLVFNGKKAYELFDKLVVKQQTIPLRPYLIMPSTSPAATIALAKKVKQWSQITQL